MSNEVREHWSSVAKWSLRLAIVGALLLVYAVVLHRYGYITSPAAFGLVSGGSSIAFVGLVLGLFGILTTWIKVQRGLRHALGGAVLSALVLAYPTMLIGPGLLLPAIHDISTDLDNPPEFAIAAGVRPKWANSLHHPGRDSRLAELQRKSYPEVAPLFMEMQTDEAFDLALSVVREQGWQVVAMQQPPLPGAPGQVEAVAYSPVMAFANDIALRVIAVPEGTIFDIRSVSRFGKTDLGDNANRIVKLIRTIEDFENR